MLKYGETHIIKSASMMSGIVKKIKRHEAKIYTAVASGSLVASQLQLGEILRVEPAFAGILRIGLAVLGGLSGLALEELKRGKRGKKHPGEFGYPWGWTVGFSRSPFSLSVSA